jgi:TetR/AcrR family transcriptional regulator
VATERRIGTEQSKTRALLLDAAEHLMLEEGYAAVTSRRVAAEAGVTPALVHYYFRTMDDLFLAVYRRRAQQGFERQEQALASRQPLWALWEFSRDPRGTALSMEFVALANHRPVIRAEIAASAQLVRDRELQAFADVLSGYGIDAERLPPVVVAMFMSSVSRFLVIEAETLGLHTGHEETVAFVEELLRRFEGDREPGT